jgi:hypothetical protein
MKVFYENSNPTLSALITIADISMKFLINLTGSFHCVDPIMN